MDDQLERVEQFKQWCDDNLDTAVGFRRISLADFDDLVNKSYTKMQSINDNSDQLSYVCGVAAGIKMMLLPPVT